MELFSYALLFVAALGGFFISAYVRLKKARKQPLVCPLGSDCDAVIYSSYSSFFGIPVELLGMFYYGLFALVALALMYVPSFAFGIVWFGFVVATSLAEAFAVYLLVIQFRVLKQWCVWCLGSFAASSGIFILMMLF